MILCNHNPHAFDNIMEDTKMNIFPKANREYNEEILRLNRHARTIKEKSLDIIKNVSKTSFNPERLFENNVQIRIVNEAFRKQQTDTESGNHVYEYGSRIPWEKELIDKILLTTGVRDIRFNEIQDMDSIQAFIWVGTYCIDDSFAVGLNTYNVYASIVRKNEQKDAFMKQLEEMFPGSDKGIINENYIEELTDDDIISDETVSPESSRTLDSYDFTICIDNIHIPEENREICRQRLNKELEKCPFIYDFVVKYEDEIDSNFNCYDVNIFMDDDIRRPSEVYKLMHMLVSIYDPKCFNDSTIYFLSYDQEVFNATFSFLVNYRERGKKIPDGYFYDFMRMCRLALDKHFDVNKCAQFIGFDFASYIMEEITMHHASEVTNTLQEIDADFILNVDDMLAEFSQQINPKFCRYYVNCITMYNGTYGGMDATKIDMEIKSRFGNEIHITKAYKMRVPQNGLNSYFLYLGCLSPDNISTVVYMLRANFDSEYDSWKFKHDIIGNDDKLNEDYIENVRDDIHKDTDLIYEEVETTIEHLIYGSFNSDFDIDLSMLPDRFYKPENVGGFEDLVKACLDNITKFSTPNLNWIDTSGITEMNNLFSYRNIFADISRWDVSNVSSMRFLFENSSVNCNLTKWDVSKVRDMTNMFAKADIHTDISNWNVSSVELMDNMFMYTEFPDDFDISGWDVSSARSMNAMFNGSNFSGDISGWNVQNVVYMAGMFGGTHEFNSDISGWNMMKVADCSNMFYNSYYACDLSGLKLNLKAKTSYMFSGCKNMKTEFLPEVLKKKKKKKA